VSRSIRLLGLTDSYVRYTHYYPGNQHTCIYNVCVTELLAKEKHTLSSSTKIFISTDMSYLLLERPLVLFQMIRSRATTYFPYILVKNSALAIDSSSTAPCQFWSAVAIQKFNPISSRRDLSSTTTRRLREFFPQTQTRRIKETPPAWPHPMYVYARFLFFFFSFLE
jgi:hypothetical protein